MTRFSEEWYARRLAASAAAEVTRKINATPAGQRSGAQERTGTGVAPIGTDGAPSGRASVHAVPSSTSGGGNAPTMTPNKRAGIGAQSNGPRASLTLNTVPLKRGGTSHTDPVYPLVALCRAAGLPEPIPEYQFHPVRKWRFDYCFVLRMVAVEIEGGLWVQGRHNRGKGMLSDMEKYNTATLLGYRILRYAPDQLGNAIRDLRIMFAEEAA